MRTCVLAPGLPMDAKARPSGADRRVQVEYVVVSVGPYRLATLRTCPVAKRRSIVAPVRASPARLTDSTLAGSRPEATSALMADGTVLLSVIPDGGSRTSA